MNNETMKIVKHRFYLGDRVFHITRDSDEGVITDMFFDIRLGWKYYVAFSPLSVEMVYYEEELTQSKIF